MRPENPVPVAGEILARRIYSPLAYAQVRGAMTVPIVQGEAARLAPLFPLAWRRAEAGPDLVAVRAFLPDERALPPGTQGVVGLLPDLLQAYPFVLSAGDGTLFDDVVPDAPTDVGASVTTADRKLSRATLLRLHMLELHAGQRAETAALGLMLRDLGLFEDWPLSFPLDGGTVEVPGLMIVKASAFGSGVLAPVLLRHGAAAAELLGYHRLSLFRAGVLLAAARAALAIRREEAARGPVQENEEISL